MKGIETKVNKTPNPIDIHVGHRIRLRRVMMGVSQEKLGEQLGLTFQQIQKYEKGANRVGASRLYHIAQLLDVAVEFFFDDIPAKDIEESSLPSSVAQDQGHTASELLGFVGSAEGLQLNTAFLKIQDQAIRKHVLNLVKTLARKEEGAPEATSVSVGLRHSA